MQMVSASPYTAGTLLLETKQTDIAQDAGAPGVINRKVHPCSGIRIKQCVAWCGQHDLELRIRGAQTIDRELRSTGGILVIEG